MAKGTTYSVRYRRKRQQKTNYKRRLNLLKSEKVRFVVRRSNKNITCQLIQYESDGDRILCTAKSNELTKMGWGHGTSNIPSAYLTGLLCGMKGKQKGVSEAILDIGLNPHIKGSKIYASQKGLMDCGISMPCDESVFPSDDRLNGGHIAAHIEKSKSITEDFDKLKKQILDSKG